MKRTLPELETILRKRICGVCTDRTTEGECGREHPADCALFRLLPEVVGAIRTVDSDDIRDYIDAIRRGVCSICVLERADGSCEERQQVQCALDAYLLLVVDAIEESTGKTFDRGYLTEAPAVQLAS
jgi:hypothetical protein